MDNTSEIRVGGHGFKTILTWLSRITLFQLTEIVLCFLFTRASLFEVLRPFGLALYCAAQFTGPAKILAAVSLMMGNLIYSGSYEAIRQLAALLIFELVIHFQRLNGHAKPTPLNRSVTLGLIVLVTGLVKGIIQGFHVYDLVASLLGSTFAFSVSVLIQPALIQRVDIKAGQLSRSGRLTAAKAILLCLVVISLKDLSISELDLSSIMAGLMVLLFARSKGSTYGACMGACVGFVLTMYRIPGSLELPGLYALAGAAAGIPIKRRIFTVSLWTTVILFFTGLSILNGDMIYGYYSVMVSGVLFLFIPPKALKYMSEYLAGPLSQKALEDEAGKRASLEASDRLYILGKALSRVSRDLQEFLSEETEDERTMAESVIEIVADRVCRRCPLCERCWGTNFIKTYKLVEKALSDLKTDETGMLEIPGWFRASCTRNEKFVESLGMAFTIYKTEKLWRARLNDARERIAEQAGIISGSIMSIARSIVEHRSRDYEIEERFLETAAGLGIPVADIRIGSESASRISADLVCEGIHRVNMDLLDNTVKSFLGNQMVRVGEMRRDMLGYSVLRYMNKPRFRTITGVARLSMEKSPVSGDSFTFFINGSGFHISAISDGAGSGNRAERYSKSTIQMLEYLMDEGVNLAFAIKLIRMYLGIKGDREPLATLDTCAINLLDGSLRFYKLGAVPSYIRNGSGVSEITGTGPDGELDGVDGETALQKITEGDFVIMVSDGVYHAFCNNGQPALQKFIASIDTVNPQQMADMILTESTLRGKGARDDMTVLVTRLW